MKYIKLLVILVTLYPVSATAYVGPGLGAGALGAILGIIGSVILALFAVLYYPIKRLIKKKRTKPGGVEEDANSSHKTESE